MIQLYFFFWGKRNNTVHQEVWVAEAKMNHRDIVLIVALMCATQAMAGAPEIKKIRVEVHENVRNNENGFIACTALAIGSGMSVIGSLIAHRLGRWQQGEAACGICIVPTFVFSLLAGLFGQRQDEIVVYDD
jgi:hypothetical protein